MKVDRLDFKSWEEQTWCLLAIIWDYLQVLVALIFLHLLHFCNQSSPVSTENGSKMNLIYIHDKFTHEILYNIVGHGLLYLEAMSSSTKLVPMPIQSVPMPFHCLSIKSQFLKISHSIWLQTIGFCRLNGTKYSRMDQVKFVKDSL